ncbi:hypothetical protein [uncultured Bacteroides sp.]|uniref:hypothetical protein n=1 Tax=uncultured Bacteroides sp. TaxID=162156 RepID=UPI002619F781|nr:hypothetical protein [uncultured Bacteroides sp.]
MCPIALGFSGTLPRICPANPTEIGHKCGGFLSVFRFLALLAVVSLGVAVGMWGALSGRGPLL